MRSKCDTVTAGDLLTLTELRALRSTSSLRGVALVVHAWTVIGGAMLAPCYVALLRQATTSAAS